MNRSIRSMTAWATVPAALFMLGMGSTAYAADTYAGCFKITTSKVRSRSILVNQTPICRSSETLHTWNQDGPQGPQGIPGFSSCSPEENTGTAPANTFDVMNLSCSGGRTATGASAIWHTPFDAADNGPFYILPRSQFMWTVVPYNHTATPQDYRFFLQCCS